ncbi:hypothetical protein [Leuconostoc fallax]|uniref:hypothetical protein n=1 Tax=Leuconostoc fallax TaxID=1251 RepID=UPI00020D96EA|nr:hypothetical protein [Leuconostoc fallax]
MNNKEVGIFDSMFLENNDRTTLIANLKIQVVFYLSFKYYGLLLSQDVLYYFQI